MIRGGIKGYYILVVNLTANITASIRGEKLVINPGVYFYIGSAKGPGGLYSRIKRHYSKLKRIHWHIDQLLIGNYSKIEYTVMIINYKYPIDMESYISKILLENNYHGIKGFGCSDKPRDYSHLYKCPLKNSLLCLNKLLELLGEDKLISDNIVLISDNPI